jgi:toxin HigB-1
VNESSWSEVAPKYRDKRTERFAAGERVNEFEGFKEQAERRLDLLETAVNCFDVMKLSSNRFEALSGNMAGQFSIRVNQQWGICFEWPDKCLRPFHVEIVQYHS